MAILTPAAGSDSELNEAILDSAYGDEIHLVGNSTHTHAAGGFQFPVKPGYSPGATILVRPVSLVGLPANGTRIKPSHADLLPKLRSTRSAGHQNTPSVRVMPGAKGWTFQYLEVHPTYFGAQSAIRVGSSLTDEQWRKDQQPENITFRHIYVPIVSKYHGNRRGIEKHGVNILDYDCYLEADIPHLGTEEAACVWSANGNGPYHSINPEWVGGTQCAMTGGIVAPLRTRAVVQASPAPTLSTAFVSWASSEHADADPPVVGQHISITTLANSMQRHATVLSYTPSTSNSGTITFTPIPEVPAVGFEIRWGANPSGIIYRNFYARRVNHTYVVEQPSDVTASAAAGGTLTVGTYNVQLAHLVTGFKGQLLLSPPTPVIPVNVAAGQKLTGTLTPHANIVAEASGGVAVYVQLPDATWRFITLAANATSWEFLNPTSGEALGVTPSHSSVSGHVWRTKNLIEFKSGTDVLVEDFICEGGRGDDAFWVKEVNQSGLGTQTRTKDVVIRNGIVRECAAFLSISGREFPVGMGQEGRVAGLENVEVHDVLVYKTGVEPYSLGQDLYLMNLANGAKNLNIHHITAPHQRRGVAILSLSVAREFPFTNLRITDSLLRRETYGIKGAGSPSTAEGTVALEAYTGGGAYTVTRNFIEGAGVASAYPAGNTWLSPEDFADLFTNPAADDYSLAPSSSAIGAGEGGTDLGADIDAVLAATATVVSGNSSPAATPSVTTTTLPPATVGQAYSAALQAAEGTPPYTWAITAGLAALNAAGLALSGNIISGTPTGSATTLSITVRATDDASQQSPTRTLSLQIQAAPTEPLLILPAVVTPAVVGVGYSFTPTATGGVQPYAWSVDEALPEGFDVNRPTGTISGVPQTAGGHVLTLAVTDAAGTTTRQEIILTVLGTASVELTLTDLDRAALAWHRSRSAPAMSFANYVRSVAQEAIDELRAAFDRRRGNESRTRYISSPLTTRNAVEAELGMTLTTLPED